MRTRMLLLALLLLAADVPLRAGEEPADRGGERVARLVALLGSESWEEREAAYRDLAALGPDALPWLREYREADDPEVARLVGRLLHDLESRERDEIQAALSTRNDSFPGSEAFQALVARGRKILPDLYRALDEEDATYPSYDYWRMRNAYAVIAELVTEDDLPLLLARLDHPNPQQRYLLTPLLRGMDRDVVFKALLARLADAKGPPMLRAQILEMCRDSSLGGNDARFREAARALLDDAEAGVRAAAVNWFALQRDEEVLDRIVSASRDPALEVRIAAVRALRLYKGDAIRAALEAALRDPEAEVRSAALESIRNQAGPDLAPLLRPFLKDPDPMVRSSAAQTLAQMGDKAALPTLVELLSERGDEFLTRALHSVVGAVSRMGDEAAIPPLLRLLEDSEENARLKSYRYLVLSAVITLGGDAVFPKVKPWLTGREVQNRHMVLDALAELETEEVVPIFLDALARGERPDRTSAVRGLVRRGRAEAAPAILAVLRKEDDPWFLSEAVKALIAFDATEAAPDIRRLLSVDPNDGRNVSLLYSVIRAMVYFGIADSAPRIAEVTLASPNFQYRGVEALGRLGNPDVVPSLRAMFADETGAPRRMQIALALARLGRKEELAGLFDAPGFGGDDLERAECLVALGRREEAEKLLDRVAGENPGNGQYLYNIGCFFAQLGNADRAFDAILRGLALRPLNPDQLLNDVDLDSLRKDPRFAEVLKKAR